MPEFTVHEHPLSSALSLVMNVKFLVIGLFYDLQEIQLSILLLSSAEA